MSLKKSILVISFIFSVSTLSACGHHFSENSTSKQENQGKFLSASEVEKLNLLVNGELDAEAQEELRRIITEENVNYSFNDERWGEGVTPIMLAAGWPNIVGVRILIEIGADPMLQDKQGRDAYGYARESASGDLLDVLISALNGPAPIDELNESLMQAAFEDDKDTFFALLDEGADPNYQNVAGETPLMAMIRGVAQQTIRPFLFMHRQGELELDFTLRNTNGETARGFALRLIDEVEDPTQKRALQGFEGFLRQLGAPLTVE